MKCNTCYELGGHNCCSSPTTVIEKGIAVTSYKG